MDTVNAVVAVGNLLAVMWMLTLWGDSGDRAYLALALLNVVCFFTNAYLAVG